MIKKVVEARRKESIVKVYGMGDEYMVKVLRRGLKRMVRWRLLVRLKEHLKGFVNHV